MKAALVYLATIAATCVSLEWRDFRGGESRLPSTLKAAQADGWTVLDTEDDLKISWYSQPDDPRFLLAFDGRQGCAGVRVAFLQSDIDQTYVGAYQRSGIFEEGKFYGKPVYYSTVLFTPENVLKSGGRRMLPDDEVALGVYLKRHGKYRKLDRDGCENSKNAFVEQGCLSGYGLVFSKFGSKSKCDSLTPFYAMFDPQGTGNLVGFGWLSFSTFSPADYKTTTYYKTLPQSSLETLFPRAPKCLTSYAQQGVTVVDVWLSHSAAKKTSCTHNTGGWTTSHCQSTRSIRPGDSSTSSEEIPD